MAEKTRKLFCAKCGRKLADKEALVHKNIDGKQEISAAHSDTDIEKTLAAAERSLLDG